MTIEQIKDLRDRTPFRPRTPHPTSGATVPVASGDHLLFSPDSQRLVLFLPTGRVWVLDPQEVAGVVYGPPNRTSRKQAPAGQMAIPRTPT
jgi:hypothetical protein